MLHKLPEEHLQVVVIIVVENYHELTHFISDVVESFDLGSVDVQVGNDAPEVRQFARLLLKHFLDGVGIRKDSFVILTKEIVVLLVIYLQFSQTINKLIFLCYIVLLLNLWVQLFENSEHRFIVEIRVDYQLKASRIRLGGYLILHDC